MMRRLGLLLLLVVLAAAASAASPPQTLREAPNPAPVSWTDAAFANVVTSGTLSLSSGAVVSNLSITTSAEPASIVCNGSCTINNVRIDSAEAVRCVVGNIFINWSWIEAEGVVGDHADGLQCYGSGTNSSVVVRNSLFRAYNHDATAGYFAADGWAGTHTFENVIFWGGPFGLRLNVDGGQWARLKNVFFITGSFGTAPFQVDIPIQQWENVRWATISNGVLIPGAAIPQP